MRTARPDGAASRTRCPLRAAAAARDLEDDLVRLERGRQRTGDELFDRTFLSPRGRAMRTLASSAHVAAGQSAAGSACERLPPMVPRFRTCASPIPPAASASIGMRERIKLGDFDRPVGGERAD